MYILGLVEPTMMTRDYDPSAYVSKRKSHPHPWGFRQHIATGNGSCGACTTWGRKLSRSSESSTVAHASDSTPAASAIHQPSSKLTTHGRHTEPLAELIKPFGPFAFWDDGVHTDGSQALLSDFLNSLLPVQHWSIGSGLLNLLRGLSGQREGLFLLVDGRRTEVCRRRRPAA